MILNKCLADDENCNSFVRKYRDYVSFKLITIGVTILILVCVAGYAMTLGSREIGFFDAYECFFKHIMGVQYEIGTDEWWDDFMVWNYQVPRVLGAIVVGIGLAICGCTMQAVTRNPLADPYTTGMTSAAEFGVAVAMVLGFGLGQSIGQYGLVINAFVFGMIPAIFIVFMTRFKDRSPATIILAGIAISYLFNSLSTLLLMGADVSTIQDVYMWQLGTLEKLSWTELPLMIVVVFLGSAIMFLMSRKMNLLALSTGNAKTLGMDVNAFRTSMLLILSVVTAVIVSFTGIIGFLGLVARHMMSPVLGGDNRFIIPAAGITGATILLVADTIGRTIILPYVIPVGVVMSFIGAPIFMYLIIRMKKEVW